VHEQPLWRRLLRLDHNRRRYCAFNGVRNRGVAVCPLDQLSQALGVDPFCCDANEDSGAEGPSRYRVIHAEKAAVVRFAIYCHLKALQRNAELGSTHGDQRGIAAGQRRSGKPPWGGSRILTAHTRWHIRDHDGTLSVFDPAAKSVLDHRGCRLIRVTGLIGMFREVLLGVLD
jgi:hypothetical protein